MSIARDPVTTTLQIAGALIALRILGMAFDAPIHVPILDEAIYFVGDALTTLRDLILQLSDFALEKTQQFFRRSNLL